MCACLSRCCFNPSGAGLQVSSFCSFLLRQSPCWCTNLQRLCASLLTSSFPFSFPFAVVCPEKEVEFQRAPNGEPCLPTHPPAPCCLRPPASHANPFCHVRVLHSSSLHVCAVRAGVACPARREPLPEVAQRPKKRALECVVWHSLLQHLDCPQQPRAGCEAGRDSGPGGKHKGRPSLTVAQEERPCSPGTSSRFLQTGSQRTSVWCAEEPVVGSRL